MAEETVLLEENKLTEPRANLNPAFNNPSKRSLSGSRGTEDNFGEPTSAGHQIMGASIQPGRGTADTLKPEEEPPKRDDGYPSSLRSTSTDSSFSLEISLSTTNNSNKESRPLPLRTPPDSREKKTAASVTNSYSPFNLKPLQEREQLAELKSSPCMDKLGSYEFVTSKSTNIDSSLKKTFLSSLSGDGKLGAQPMSASQPPKAPSTQDVREPDSFREEKRASQEDDMFYAFVILHALEDTEEAVRLKSRLESISSTTGATFSEDFAMPGRSTFKCVEDAIDNSAFVMLLLTPNFNNHLNEMNADSALMNSIERPHKYNTVIPLLPRANSLAREQTPTVLKTKNPLDETKSQVLFEKMARKVLNPINLRKHKSIWRQTQQVNMQRERQQSLLEENRLRRDYIRESTRVQELEEQTQQLQMQQQRLPPPYAPQPNLYQAFPGLTRPFGPMPSYYNGNVREQPPSNIHIQNAKCIMIGNNSTMTVGGVVDSKEEESA